MSHARALFLSLYLHVWKQSPRLSRLLPVLPAASDLDARKLVLHDDLPAIEDGLRAAFLAGGPVAV